MEVRHSYCCSSVMVKSSTIDTSIARMPAIQDRPRLRQMPYQSRLTIASSTSPDSRLAQTDTYTLVNMSTSRAARRSQPRQLSREVQ